MVKRMIIGVSGASGAPLAVDTLRTLQKNHPEIERHLVITRGGRNDIAARVRSKT